MSELNAAERAALARFERAINGGATERTALNLAAWAWLEHSPNESLAAAIQEVTRLVRSQAGVPQRRERSPAI
jgi:hypothetical protein